MRKWEQESCDKKQLLKKKEKRNVLNLYGRANSYRLDKHGHIIKPTAFDDYRNSFEQNECKLPILWHHDHSKPIGRVVQIKNCSDGLYIHAELLTEVQQTREALCLWNSDIVCNLSIGFYIQESEYNERGVRIIKKAILAEISIVGNPADDGAEIYYIKEN